MHPLCTPSDHLGKALGYANKMWPCLHLKRYALERIRLDMDENKLVALLPYNCKAEL